MVIDFEKERQAYAKRSKPAVQLPEYRVTARTRSEAQLATIGLGEFRSAGEVARELVERMR